MSGKGTNFTADYFLTANGKKLSLERPVVMGIVNVTPDSFYDGGKLQNEKDIVALAEKHIKDGAAILDIGAVSTRPNANEVSNEEELQRLIPALKLLRKEFADIFISVDTYHAEVAKQAAASGADMINDISGGTFDEKMFETVAQTKLPYVLMHIEGTPKTMQQNPHYTNVVKEVFEFISTQKQKANEAGIQQIVIDPGFGFGKTVEHNYSLLKHLNEFEKLACPLLAGLSRKSMINKPLHIKPENALNGTTSLNTIALLNGADILRVHDVKEARQCIILVEEYFKS